MLDTARNLMAAIDATKPRPKPRAAAAASSQRPRRHKAARAARPAGVRRSGRLTGQAPRYAEGVDGDLGCGATPARGARGTVYAEWSEAEELDDLLAGEGGGGVGG